MIRIGLVPIGKIPESLVALLTAQVKDKLKDSALLVEIHPAVALPEKNTPAFVLARLAHLLSNNQQKFLIGLVEADISESEDDFIYNREEHSRRMGLVALPRLRPEFYKLPANEAVFQARVLKLILREIALLLGLSLCQDNKCLMYHARNLHEIDIKYPSFCLDCWPQLNTKISKI
ncbi:MAG: archaemetzincin [bacterium]|nr:archaemetzincin [bacterium]MDD5353722.1 archaemetzincin [bacterium]